MRCVLNPALRTVGNFAGHAAQSEVPLALARVISST